MPQSTGNSNFSPRLLQDLDRLGVRQAAEVAGDDLLQRLDRRLVDALVEELHVLGALLERVA